MTTDCSIMRTGQSTSETSTGFSLERPAGRKDARNSQATRKCQAFDKPNDLRVYTLTELKRATTNFSPHGLIGEGEFGKVFKGWVDKKTLKPAVSGCGMAVAVKRYQLENMQGLEEWKSEVKFLGTLSHPNVVKLLGYCRTDSELLLVHEFMALGNLGMHLFGRGSGLKTLPWSIRLKITIEAARGLVFLHTSERGVIHRDIKPANILLDSGYNAKISDFGLATVTPTDASHVTTRLKGTFVYAAPEYVATGHLYTKSDVYGFGVVLLEILSGQQAYDVSRPSGEQYLVRWAKPFLAEHSKIARVVDPRLDGQYPSKGATCLGKLILGCLSHDRKSRPSMQRVLQILEQIEAVSATRVAASSPARVSGSASPQFSSSPYRAMGAGG